MNIPPLLQLTSVRTRIVDGQVLIDIMHTAQDDAGRLIKLPWVALTPKDAAKLVGVIQRAARTTAAVPPQKSFGIVLGIFSERK